MKKLLLFSAVFCLLVCSIYVQAAKKAKADLLNAKGSPVGIGYLERYVADWRVSTPIN